MGKPLPGSSLYLIHYPDGEVFKPVECTEGTVLGEPVYYDGVISVAAVDFNAEEIRILNFDCAGREVTEAAVLPLSSVEDCYNLRLHVHPLTLSRQPNDGTFDIVWPERKRLTITENESFFLRDGNKLFFSRWYEDPDYREEVVIRDADSGEILEVLPGDIHVMPDGEFWYLKG